MPASTSTVSDPSAAPQALIAAARSYLDLGMVLTPTLAATTKGAYLPDWTTRRLSLEEIEKELDRPGKGVGVLLGEPSGHLVDVDLDHPAAVVAADLLLPFTGLVSGRTDRPETHRFYRSPGAVTSTFRTESTGMLVELRSTGCQTVLPPSPHPEGRYHWDSRGEPALVDAQALRVHVGRVAAASLLITRGWAPEVAVEFVQVPDLDQLSTWEEAGYADASLIRDWCSVEPDHGPDDRPTLPETRGQGGTSSRYTQEVLERIGGVVGAARLLGIELHEGRQRCPWHHGKGARSLQVKVSVWRCHAGCGQGNAIHLAAKVLGVSYGSARAELATRVGIRRSEAGGGVRDDEVLAETSGVEGGGGVNGRATSEGPGSRGTGGGPTPREHDAPDGVAWDPVPVPPAFEGELPPSVVAGLLLAACTILSRRGLPGPTAKEVIERTGVSRTRGYEMRAEVLDALRGLWRPVGRPPREPTEPARNRLADLAMEVRDFLLAHPGAVVAGPRRRSYTDSFRRFVVELRERHEDLDAEEFAQGVGVPARTITDWMRPGVTIKQAAPPQTTPAQPDPPSGDPQTTPAQPDPPTEDPSLHQRIQAIVEAWRGWHGNFSTFCRHVQEGLLIPYGRTLISSILEASGARIPRRRPGRSPDERALRDQFQVFFPGAQWSADGTPIPVEVAGEQFVFNLELVVDPHTGAFAGASIRDEEDSMAVVEAFVDATEETDGQPLALLLDNRPSNHAEEVDDALGVTLRQRSTPGRPQNKAHSEGGFGLLAQRMPPLTLASLRPIEIARSLLHIVVTTWARTLNHRPRRDRAGRSRAELYAAASPTEEEVASARSALEERVRRQEQARTTLLARQDPLVRQVLEQAFARLGLDDPEGHFRAAIGRYPLGHVVDGVAVFEGKRISGTLPPDVDARYLLGIVRNISAKDEGINVAEALWRERLNARDQVLLALDGERLQAEASLGNDVVGHVRLLADKATTTVSALERSFWLRALADVITVTRAEEHEALFRVAAHRIHATFRAPIRERQDATRRLAGMLLPLS